MMGNMRTEAHCAFFSVLFFYIQKQREDMYELENQDLFAYGIILDSGRGNGAGISC